MRKEQFYFDEKRLMVRGRFYELQVNGGGHAPMHKLCSFEECDFRPDGHRRSDREQTNFLLRLYQEKLSNLQEKEELKRIEKLAEESSVSVQDAMQHWLDHVQEFRNPRTVYEYRLVCQRYVEMVSNHPVKNVKKFHESRFLNGLKQKGMSEHTQAKYLRQLQTFWRWAFEQEYTNNMFRVSKLRPTVREPSIYSDEDLVRIEHLIIEKLSTTHLVHRQAARNQYRAFMCLKETGMRGNEVRSLRLENINVDDRKIQIRDDQQTGFRIKGRREESVPMTDTFNKFISEDLKLRDKQEVYFCDNGAGLPQWSSVNQMGKTFDRICNRLGIDGVKPLHGFRAFVATKLLQNGVDVSLVRDILRHKELSTTLGYLNRSKMPYLDAMNRLSIAM